MSGTTDLALPHCSRGAFRFDRIIPPKRFVPCEAKPRTASRAAHLPRDTLLQNADPANSTSAGQALARVLARKISILAMCGNSAGARQAMGRCNVEFFHRVRLDLRLCGRIL